MTTPKGFLNNKKGKIFLSSRNSLKPFDSNFCFAIQDFSPGDSIIVLVENSREKAIVESVDSGKMLVGYSTSSGNGYAVLDDIVFLDSPQVGWLD